MFSLQPRALIDEHRAIGTRIAWAMAFRVVLITVLLGATLVLYYDVLKSTRTPSLNALLGVIGLTYLLTIVYGIWHRTRTRLKTLAYVQFTMDALICGVLAYATGGIASGFNFLFHLWVMVAAVVLTGRAAFVVAGISTFVLLALTGFMSLGILSPLPPFSGSIGDRIPIGESLYFFLVNVVSLFLVAALVTSLVERIERAGKGLAHERARREDLSALHSDTVRSLTVGLATTDLDGNLLDMNPEGCRLMGLEEVALAPEAFEKWLPDFGRYRDGLMDSGKVEGIGVRSDGRRLPVEFTVTPRLNAEGVKQGCIVSFNDVSKERQLEVALEKAGRLAALGELAAGLAHEIRNPLSAVSGSFQMLSSHPAFSDEDRTLSLIVSRELERIERLVEDMLDYARPREPMRSRFNISIMLNEVVKAFLAGKEDADLRVSTRIADGVELLADENLLRQLIWNLLRNANQAMDGEGQIDVSLEIVDGAFVVIGIADSGPGVEESEVQKIFNPFYSTRKQGVGLGLSICNRIAKDHGGRIEVSRSAAGGALMTLRLPLG